MTRISSILVKPKMESDGLRDKLFAMRWVIDVVPVRGGFLIVLEDAIHDEDVQSTLDLLHDLSSVDSVMAYKSRLVFPETRQKLAEAIIETIENGKPNGLEWDGDMVSLDAELRSYWRVRTEVQNAISSRR